MAWRSLLAATGLPVGPSFDFGEFIEVGARGEGHGVAASPAVSPKN